MEKLEISSVEVSQSDSIGVYKMANGYQMIDGDTSTSGIVYLEEYILSVSFSLEVKLKDKAEVHAVIINAPLGGGSSLTLQGKTTYVQTAGLGRALTIDTVDKYLKQIQQHCNAHSP